MNINQIICGESAAVLSALVLCIAAQSRAIPARVGFCFGEGVAPEASEPNK